MTTRALVVSGGGCTGAFAVGAVRYMIEQKGLSFDMACGTSTGSLISPLVITGEIETLVQIYTTVTTQDIFLLRSPADMLANGSAFSSAPLANLIGTMITDARWTTISTSPKQLVIAAACLQTAQSTYFCAGPMNLVTPPHTSTYKLQSKDDLMRAMLASSSDPALFPSTQIPANSPNQFVDGGVLDFAPISIAMLNGVDEVYSVVISPENPAPVTNNYVSMIDTLARTIDMFAGRVDQANVGDARDLSNGAIYLAALQQRLVNDYKLDPAALANIFAAPQPGVTNPFQGVNDKKFVLIRPDGVLTNDPNTFDPVAMKAMMAQGFAKAQQVLG